MNKSNDTPSFYRSVSQTESLRTNKYFWSSAQINYDSPERYLFEFFKHPGYLRFRREYYIHSRKIDRTGSPTNKKVKLGKLLKDKHWFMEIDQTILLLSPVRVKNCPIVRFIYNLNDIVKLRRSRACFWIW